jgi:hypothetical protein
MASPQPASVFDGFKVPKPIKAQIDGAYQEVTALMEKGGWKFGAGTAMHALKATITTLGQVKNVATHATVGQDEIRKYCEKALNEGDESAGAAMKRVLRNCTYHVTLAPDEGYDKQYPRWYADTGKWTTGTGAYEMSEQNLEDMGKPSSAFSKELDQVLNEAAKLMGSLK